MKTSLGHIFLIVQYIGHKRWFDVHKSLLRLSIGKQCKNGCSLADTPVSSSFVYLFHVSVGLYLVPPLFL